MVHPKYVSGEQILVAPMPHLTLPKAIAGPGLLAQVFIDNYLDHLPLCRQQLRFNREGTNVPYSTIRDWVSGTRRLIAPNMKP